MPGRACLPVICGSAKSYYAILYVVCMNGFGRHVSCSRPQSKFDRIVDVHRETRLGREKVTVVTVHQTRHSTSVSLLQIAVNNSSRCTRKWPSSVSSSRYVNQGKESELYKLVVAHLIGILCVLQISQSVPRAEAHIWRTTTYRPLTHAFASYDWSSIRLGSRASRGVYPSRFSWY